MAQDTTLVNVVASDTIRVLTDGCCSVLIAIVFGAIFSW